MSKSNFKIPKAVYYGLERVLSIYNGLRSTAYGVVDSKTKRYEMNKYERLETFRDISHYTAVQFVSSRSIYHQAMFVMKDTDYCNCHSTTTSIMASIMDKPMSTQIHNHRLCFPVHLAPCRPALDWSLRVGLGEIYLSFSLSLARACARSLSLPLPSSFTFIRIII